MLNAMPAAEGFLRGVRILELSDERGEYAGKLLAGLGADVIKIEPPGGEVTRSYGPFLNDIEGSERSLHFAHYNFGKRSVTLDLGDDVARGQLSKLLAGADAIITTWEPERLRGAGLDYAKLIAENSRLVFCHIVPFGLDGPWAEYKGSDLVHLALGGVMMNCGYDADPTGYYDLPPIAPQVWQSYHIAGEMAVIGILGALYHSLATAEGQLLTTSIHQAVAQQTETDVPNWIYGHLTHFRRTARHSFPDPRDVFPAIVSTKDGRWLLPYRSYAAGGSTEEFLATVRVLAVYGMEEDLLDSKYLASDYRANVVVGRHIQAVIARFIGAWTSRREIWRDMQAVGATWGPIRRPDENVADDHWMKRHTFVQVQHPESDQVLTDVGAKWYCAEVPWRTSPRAPKLGEHNSELLGREQASDQTREPNLSRVRSAKRRLALQDVRMLDLGWLLASAGAGRFLAAQGAEVIKVEHSTRLDAMRWNNGIVPRGGRKERDAAVEAIPVEEPGPEEPNRSGFFMDINAGKRAISLNLKTVEGKELLGRLIGLSNVISEGFSPGTLDRMGFGYDRLKQIRADIVYVQQSGMGQVGTYGKMRSYGPVAQGFCGLTEMSGLPAPFPPSGIGYSYLDWFGAYNMAIAILAGLYRQQATGLGCWIDSSQVESGIYLSGPSVLDFSANGRSWTRYGNQSPYKPAAPHGAYRVAGNDRWIAISCFTESDWRALIGILDATELTVDDQFTTLGDRLANQDELDIALTSFTIKWDGYELMEKLQAAGVAAGVCQTAQDRCDRDPQLRALEWLVELNQSAIGTWPCKDIPVKFDRTPVRVGGTINRHGPSYGEDNEYVFGELLGLRLSEIRRLKAEGVI
jgi:crotonobetainyl-CoA:carnitine CoA-transferase CaiB-like acyl-CoA transferase